MPGTKIRKDDIVQVIAGRDRGKQGRVLQVDRKKNRILVEHVMMAKKHVRPNPQKQIKGGIAEREAAIHISNVMLVAAGKPVRLGARVDAEGDRTRIGRHGGEEIDLS
jgi:large subunit ribosomal protein L24